MNLLIVLLSCSPVLRSDDPGNITVDCVPHKIAILPLGESVSWQLVGTNPAVVDTSDLNLGDSDLFAWTWHQYPL